MSRQLLSRTGLPMRLALMLTVVFALSAGIGVATGAIPASDGTISACYSKLNGALRVIDRAARQTCKSSETPLSWKQGTSAPAVRVSTISLSPGATTRAAAHCPSGQHATGGGFTSAIFDPRDDVVVKDSEPVTFAGQPVGWSATFTNDSTADEDANAIAICLS
jgi:hypothetical protein